MWASWQNLPAKSKVVCMLGVIGTVVAAQSIAILWVQKDLNFLREEMDHIQNTEVKSIQAQHLVSQKNLAAMDVIAFNSHSSTNATEVMEFKKNYEKTKKEIEQKLVAIDDFCKTYKCENTSTTLKTNITQLDENIDKLFVLAQQGKLPPQVLEELDKKIDSGADATSDILGDIYLKMEEEVKLQQARVENQKTLQSWITWGSVFALLGAVLLIFSTFQGGLMRPLERMSKNLKTAVTSVRKSTQGSSDISKKMSLASQNQEAAVTESVAAMTQIENVVRRSEENLVQADKLAQNARAQGMRSSQALDKIESSVEHLLSLRVDLQDLERVMEEISFKTETINNIVFKTQVLSLNASIEASRAGAHGKGFSVVASEVGRLADLSGKAAEEISTILLNSRRKVQQVVEGIGAGIEKTNQVTLASKSEISALIAEVDAISQRVSDVRLGAQEQTHAIEQVVRGMADLSKDTRTTASLATDSLSMTSELAYSVEEISQAFAQTQLMLYGQGGRGMPPHGHEPPHQRPPSLEGETRSYAPHAPTPEGSGHPGEAPGKLHSLAARIASKAKQQEGGPTPTSLDTPPPQDKAS